MSMQNNSLGSRPQSVTQSAVTKSQSVGGKTMKRRRRPINITGTRGRGAFIKNWSKQQPSYHERTVMLKRCGKKCFLGPNKTFPICSRNTCKRNRKGVYAAYMRANEYITIKGTPRYKRISAKARKLLHKNKCY